jgi:sugar fermentation stimulation protein A
MNSPTLNLFGKTYKATFIKRPNRFIVECRLNKRKVRAYLPNPGRLWELFLPGATLFLTKSSDPERKTQFTCVGVEKDGAPVMLHTHHTNTAVKWLIEKERIPSLRGYKIVRSEATFGKSRFDFLLEKNREKLVLEVKSYTLFGSNIAMFPDAPTTRGKKHLEELAGLSGKGLKTGVIFVVHSPLVKYFLPEYHTDLDFSKTFYSIRKKILINAIGLSWQNNLTLSPVIRELKIPWDLIKREADDCGNYILIFHLKRPSRISAGGLGTVTFQKGYYLYVGSARKNLQRRIERHRRHRKNLFWHIDYLREKAEFIHALPVRSRKQLECEIASSLQKITQRSEQDFGSSDCNCSSHLFGMTGNPLRSPAFIRLLQHFRTDRLEHDLHLNS